MSMPARWQPYCGAEYLGPDPSRPVICDSERHPADVMHRNSGSGFAWWAFMSYPRTRPEPRADEDAAA